MKELAKNQADCSYDLLSVFKIEDALKIWTVLPSKKPSIPLI